MENRMNIAKPNSATHYDVWQNPPELADKYPTFKLQPTGTFKPLDASELTPVPGFEGKYSVTPSGAVYSHRRKVKSAFVKGNQDAVNRIAGGLWLKPGTRPNGTRTVVLQDSGDKRTMTLDAVLKLTYGSIA